MKPKTPDQWHWFRVGKLCARKGWAVNKALTGDWPDEYIRRGYAFEVAHPIKRDAVTSVYETVK